MGVRLSIVIVNYNVKYFLRQCLSSVRASEQVLPGGEVLELEVWVVDNDSVDGSAEMVRQEFPEVHLICNHENVGFARANNQALQQATGDYLLLLNPDTVVQPDTLALCIDHMRQHPETGGLTVKMVDGRGRFLPESKRGFPTPEASFYKISGLVKLFPHSRRIAAYYAGHMDEDEEGEIAIMCGAFLMLSRQAYQAVGGLDESYFMYGEDIDFSWRIKLAGFQNYYLPRTRIIHYKGESTRKGSMNYVYTFYNAMAIFVNRYYSDGKARIFNLLLKVAIWARAALAWLKRIATKVALPVADFAVAYGGYALIKTWWQHLQHWPADYYAPVYMSVVVPVYILVLMLCSWLHGGYDKPVRMGRIARGMGIGLLLLLAFYSLLDESQRYSRMLLLMGAVWTLAGTLLVRLLLSALGIKGYALHPQKRGSTLVVGQADEVQRIEALLVNLGYPKQGIVGTNDDTAHHLQDLIRIEHAESVIFCGRDVQLAHIINLMAKLRTTGVEYRIAPSGADYVIGSEQVLSSEELYLTDLNTISSDSSRRQKRLFDVGTATFALLLSPVLYWFQTRKKQYFRDVLQVLFGRRTWVGYTGHPGIFAPADLVPDASADLHDRLMLRYMRHYRAQTDWQIISRNWNKL